MFTRSRAPSTSPTSPKLKRGDKKAVEEALEEAMAALLFEVLAE